MTRSFKVAAVVTDIEGTTSSIAFVKDTLFPYADTHLADFVDLHPEECAPILADAAALGGDPSMPRGEVVALLRRWIAEDRKLTPLKTIQGLIWAQGYASGVLTGHIYPDAAAQLQAWHEAGIPLYVYSSGSIAAQRQIFGHTVHGDLKPLFKGYFDTRTGPKLEAESYSAIAGLVGHAPHTVLFLSDHRGEIAAAHAAGLLTCVLDRETHPTPLDAVSSFASIQLTRL